MSKINSQRLWDALMELARIGATAKGGVRRLALSDEDRRGRDCFVGWCRAAGLAVEVDAIGNIFARRAGTVADLPPVAIGSHLDSQPSGGKFDGAYGVMAGLEVVRTLDDTGVRTRAPIEVVAWTNEEGSRFVPTCMGSGVYAGVHALEHVLQQRDVEGVSVRDALAAIGYAGAASPHRLGAYFEAHIEQGPVLEQERKTIGVVLGALGQRWFDVVVLGQDAHAGPTPMQTRRDALLAASRLVGEVHRIGSGYPDYARGTVGFMAVKPNSRNVVPGEVRMSVDLRNAKWSTLDAMVEDLRRCIRAVQDECRVEISLDEVVAFAPSEFAEDLVAHVRDAAERLGHSHRDIVSGAAHDAVYLSRIAPTAMVFVPCAGGISHNELESARPEDLAAGCDVLLHAVLRRAEVAA
jgi:N-carbamoyl-L-amino-acid hydrolase|nr:Zn-dependent hydrolase [Caldimonas sp.]